MKGSILLFMALAFVGGHVLAQSSTVPSVSNGTQVSSIITSLDALADNLPSFIRAVVIACHMLAFALAFSVVNNLRKAGSNHHGGNSVHPLSTVVWTLLVMLLLVTIPQVLKGLHGTFGLGSGYNMMDYSNFSNASDQSSMQENIRENHPLRPVFLFVNVIGLIAVVRGIMSLRRAGAYGNHDRSIQKGIVLIVAGFWAMNIVLFMLVLAKTFNMSIIARILDLS